MKIGFLGTGSWGFCLASLLASNGHQVSSWSKDRRLVELLRANKDHPFLAGHFARPGMAFSTHMKEVVEGADLIVEAVTSAGLRSVLTALKEEIAIECPLVITSKGIEQNSGKILPEVAVDVLGESCRGLVGILSGPSFAAEVIKSLPTLVVASAYHKKEIKIITKAFANSTFRVYPNEDILGVAFGGALKNIIAIACGIADGMELGNSAKAAVITRGLHEMRKLAVAYGCKSDTLNGLSGLGDLCLTCSSSLSRNHQFGYRLAQGFTSHDAQDKIKMVVEGAYTCVSTLQLSRAKNIPMPITEMVYEIIYKEMDPKKAVRDLMLRETKEEHQ